MEVVYTMANGKNFGNALPILRFCTEKHEYVFLGVKEIGSL